MLLLCWIEFVGSFKKILQTYNHNIPFAIKRFSVTLFSIIVKVYALFTNHPSLLYLSIYASNVSAQVTPDVATLSLQMSLNDI